MRFVLSSLILLISLSLIASSAQVVQLVGDEQCFELYFVNTIYFINSSSTLYDYLETPINFSSPPYRQEVYIIYTWGNAYFNKSEKIVQVHSSNGTIGGFIARVLVCGKELDKVLKLLKIAFRNPFYGKDLDKEPVPDNISSKYLLKPAPIVVEKVRPTFEEWLRWERGLNPKNMSHISLAVAAAYFIYGRVYLEYGPSDIPRTLEQVIEDRKGDCDDMSRVLVNLLWSYKIPAKIVTGYTYLRLSLEAPLLGRSLRIFKNAAPHAFVMIYVPKLGWIPLDLLAGSMIKYPFVFRTETVHTNITQKYIELIIEYHKRYSFIQMISILNKDEYNKLSLNGSKPSRLALWAISEVIGKATERAGLTNLTTTTTKTEVITVTKTKGIIRITTETITETKTMTVEKTTAITKTLTKTTTRTHTITQTITTTITITQQPYTLLILVIVGALIAIALIVSRQRT